MIIGGLLKWLSRVMMKSVVFGLVSFATLIMVIYSIDNFTKSSYGEVNLYIIAGAFSFFPMFTGLFVISFWNQVTREKRKSKKRNEAYLKEDITKSSLDVK